MTGFLYVHYNSGMFFCHYIYKNLVSCPITFLNFSQIWKRRTSPTCLLRCCIKCLKPSLRSRYISPSNIIEKMSYFSFWLSLICRYVEVNNILFSVSVPCNYARIKLMEKAIGFSAVHCWRMETPWEESITDWLVYYASSIFGAGVWSLQYAV